jgi:transcriptional regulator with XRE-family HTH domain
MSPQQPPTREEMFSASVRHLRRARAWTQTDLARAMKTRGFDNFHQQTIQRIEDGKRPVRLEEAYALAAELGSSVELMSHSEESVRRYDVSEVVLGVDNLLVEVMMAVTRWVATMEPLAQYSGHALRGETLEDRREVGAAGCAFVHRAFADAERVLLAAQTCAAGLWRAPAENDGLDADRLPAALRELLSEYNPDPDLADMTMPELANAYCQGHFFAEFDEEAASDGRTETR